MSKEKLCFAPLVRVSTEKQEKRGESLRTQQAGLEADIKSMGGKIYKWYVGAESATPDHERAILDRLIADCKAKKFDAIIIWDVSRWSRDNKRSAEDLDILKKNKIRFFVRQQEYNLYDENAYFMISLHSLMGHQQAMIQARKSMESKIARAEKNWPATGRLPHARTFDRVTNEWGIDQTKQKIIEDCATRYLAGESLEGLAKLYSMNFPNLLNLLKHRSGDKWPVKFYSERLQIDKTVALTVPRLLPESIIKQIHKQSEANRTYLHGQTKNNYLLSRMIFCDHCRLALIGEANHGGRLYYRHLRAGCGKTYFNSINADIIETSTIRDIFGMFGDAPRIAEAIKKAIPNQKEAEELRERLETLETQMKKNNQGKEKILDMVEAGSISVQDTAARMKKIKDREAQLLSEIDKIKKKIDNIPTPTEITRQSRLYALTYKNIMRSEPHLKQMTFDEKRKLLQPVFAGKDSEGRRLGVYVGLNKKGKFIYNIRGILGERTFDLRDYPYLEDEPWKIEPFDYLTTDDKQNMHSKYKC